MSNSISYFKPCPFCGETEIVFKTNSGRDYGSEDCSVECKSCRAMFPHYVIYDELVCTGKEAAVDGYSRAQ